METPAQTIDRLITVDLKMWHNQEFLYAIRRMAFAEFHAKYGGNEELYGILKKCCDLNVQRNELIRDADKALVALVKAAVAGNTEGYVQEPHKTY